MRQNELQIVNVGVWGRASLNDPASDSIKHHLIRCNGYATSRNWNVAEVYILDGVHGDEVMEHAEAQRMMEDIRTGRIQGLIFSHLERLGRLTKSLIELADFFNEHGAALVSLNQQFDTSTPAGMLFYTIVAAVTQYDRQNIAQRVADSVPARAKLGKCTGGQAVYGYRWVDNKLEPDPEERAIRVLIYKLFQQHGKVLTVSNELNKMGLKTRAKRPWTDMTVRNLIKDTTAKGQHCSNRFISPRRTKGKKRAGIKPEAEWVYNPVEPIVELELWEECNALLSARASYTRPARLATYPFSGLLQCFCGGKLYSDTVRDDDGPRAYKYRCRSCHHSVPAAVLDHLFRSTFERFFCSPEALAEHTRAADDALGQKRQALDTQQKELAKVRRTREKLFKAFDDDSLSPDQFGEHDREQAERQAQIEKVIATLEGELDALQIQRDSIEQEKQQALLVNLTWDDFTDAEKQGMLRAMVEKIDVGETEIELELAWEPRVMELARVGFSKAQNSGTGFLTFQNPRSLIRVKVKSTAPATKKTLQPPGPLDGWGQHVKFVRRQRRVSAGKLGKQLGVCEDTVRKWEKGRQPRRDLLPAIADWLGYCPIMARPA